MTVDGTVLDWAWLWRSGVAAAIIAAAAVYARGWRRTRQRYTEPGQPAPPIASAVALVLFISGLSMLVLALLSPVHTLATQFFFMRVTQHLLLVALVPCLLLVANPLPVMFNGLPFSWQSQILGRLETASTLRENVRLVTAPGTVWILFASCVWLWYDPNIHQATLEHAWLHYLETVVLFSVSLLYWWHITAAAPHIHKPLPPLVRIAYTAIGTWPVKLVGIILLFTRPKIYDYPSTFQLTGLIINDQSLGGIIGWILGGIVFSATATVLMRQWLSGEDEKPTLPESAWATDEAMLAPGFKKPPQ